MQISPCRPGQASTLVLLLSLAYARPSSFLRSGIRLTLVPCLPSLYKTTTFSALFPSSNQPQFASPFPLPAILTATMFSTRVITFLFFIAAFGLFVCAKPVDVSGLAAREILAERSSDLVARGGTCNTKGTCLSQFSRSTLFVLLDNL